MAHSIRLGTPARAQRSLLHQMQHLVTHVITVDRPIDWASVCAMIPTVQQEAQLLNLSEPRFSRLMFKGEAVYDTNKKRDRWDWNSPKVAVMIEGWAEKP